MPEAKEIRPQLQVKVEIELFVEDGPPIFQLSNRRSIIKNARTLQKSLPKSSSSILTANT